MTLCTLETSKNDQDLGVRCFSGFIEVQFAGQPEGVISGHAGPNHNLAGFKEFLKRHGCGDLFEVLFTHCK